MKRSSGVVFWFGTVIAGWVVKSSQWKNKEFDYLVCVAADEMTPKALAFTYDEVVGNFTLCNFVFSSTGEVCRDYRILDLIDGGEHGLEFNRSLALTVLKFEGQATPFEVDFNKNPNPFFEDYGLNRILEQIKKGQQKKRSSEEKKNNFNVSLVTI